MPLILNVKNDVLTLVSPVVIHNTQIKQVHSYKHLCIHINSMLMWQIHDDLCAMLQRLNF